jgi:dimethylargininase
MVLKDLKVVKVLEPENPENPEYDLAKSMSRLIAMTRGVSEAIVRCELTHLPRQAIDFEKASAQHAAYERALEDLGCDVRRLPAGAGMADSLFIEDAAVVLDETAILMRPGAESRRLEVPGVEAALATYRRLARIESPGTMDGGDVLVAGRTIFVGASSRTNDAGIAQLSRMVRPLGYQVRAVAVTGCLHLKSAVTAVSDDVLLINQAWTPAGVFAGFDVIDVDPGEAMGANIVRVADRLLYSAAFSRTRERLERRGFAVTAVDVSEIAKAEGAVTCCSLIFGI